MKVYEYITTRRAICESPGQIVNPVDVVSIFKEYFAGLETEKLAVLALDTKNKVIGMETVYIGNVTGSPVRVGEVFRFAVRNNATAIVIAHNHPSLDITPSADDLNITREFVSAGKLLDIEVLDHLIVAEDSHWSARQIGMMM